mgnify:CR=1 FL=1
MKILCHKRTHSFLSSSTPFFNIQSLVNTIPLDRAEEIAMHKLGRKPELIELNRQAFKAGVEVIQKWKEADRR